MVNNGGLVMKNTLVDLNDQLFEQLERLNDIDLKGDDLEEEIKRSRSIENVAKQIINNGRLVLDSQKFLDDRLNIDNDVPKMLSGDDEQ